MPTKEPPYPVTINLAKNLVEGQSIFLDDGREGVVRGIFPHRSKPGFLILAVSADGDTIFLEKAFNDRIGLVFHLPT